MKILTAIFLGSMVIVAGSPAFAGRDLSQIMEQQRVMKAKQAEQLAQERQGQKGLAGATGMPGKVGPGARAKGPRRDPTAHP
jgi:hypothetical protein